MIKLTTFWVLLLINTYISCYKAEEISEQLFCNGDFCESSFDNFQSVSAEPEKQKLVEVINLLMASNANVFAQAINKADSTCKCHTASLDFSTHWDCKGSMHATCTASKNSALNALQNRNRNQQPATCAVSCASINNSKGCWLNPKC
jgi:hypothetical protein